LEFGLLKTDHTLGCEAFGYSRTELASHDNCAGVPYLRIWK
jgi:hypothetical protein